MLLITHDLGVVAETAHRVGVMYAGQIVEQASREQLFAKPLHPYTQKLFAALPSAGREGQPLSAIPGSVPPLGSIKQGCRFAARCENAWAQCTEQTPEWTVVERAGGEVPSLSGTGERIRETEDSSPLPLAGEGLGGEGASVLYPVSRILNCRFQTCKSTFPSAKVSCSA